MITPTRGKVLCEVVTRERVLPSGIILPDRQRLEKKDNICQCLGVGDEVKVIRRTDIIHYKENFGQKIRWEGKLYVFLKTEEIIAIERPEIIALGSTVICKLVQEEKIGTFIVLENVRQNSGDYYGEVVAVGPDFPDKLERGDRVIFFRGEGYRFRTLDRVDLICLQAKWIGGKHEV